MAVSLKWKGDACFSLLERQARAGVQAAAEELKRIGRMDASVQNPGERVRITRRRKGGNKRSRTIYPIPSRPGSPPRRRTGFGQKNIVANVLWQQGKPVGRTGYTRLARYMTFHELGIHYRRVGLQQRPTLVPALNRNRERIHKLALLAARAVK